jgi:reverse transcriptase-like protein/integrase-like protein/chromodomain-containing protein/p58 integrase-like protein
VDGTENKRGTIKTYVKLDLEINGRKTNTELLVTGLGKERIILGFPWLYEHNPDINWKNGEFSWREVKKRRFLNLSRRKPHPCGPLERAKELTRQALRPKRFIPKPSIEEIPDEEEPLNSTQQPLDDNELSVIVSTITGDMDDAIWINSKSTTATRIQAEINVQKKVLPLEEQVPKEFHEFLDVFSEEKAARFPESRSWDHKIEMKDTFVPKSFKTYNLTPQEQIELDKFLKENLEKGYIRPSQSPMASPFFFVDKKDGKLRPCQDYRYLNEHTVKNAYPLPLITELLDKLKGARRFTKLDVRWGYNNVRIRDGDQWKAAFKTNRGLFEPTVMFFGLCNSPATFQALMDDIFGDMIGEHIIIVYMDDIFLFAPDEITLAENTKKVLARLQKNDLFLKPTKCEFNKTKVEYLGMIIEEGKISMDPGKLRGIRDWPPPTTLKQVRGFLGFGNFYRRFIRHFSNLAKPLNDLLKKDQRFEWTDDCQKAFDELKKRFTEEPVLMMPDQSKPFQIETDASKYATGAVLTQLDINGDRHPVSFISKTFSPAERNYEIYDRELLAIIRALEEWRHYIQGSAHTTIVLSDHKNLTYYREAKKLNRRQARWSLYLSEFDVKLVHTPGNKMIQSDALSRRPDHCPDDDTDNEDIIMLPDDMFLNLIDVDLQRKIAMTEDLDNNAAEALKLILETAPTSMTAGLDDWKVETSNGQNILFYKGKNYIPRNTELRRELVKTFHDHETAGHPGEIGTYNAIRQHYWWPGLRTFVKNYVQGCGICQQFKIDRTPSKPAYIPTEGAKSLRPFANCSMDLITDLPPAEGFDSILVVVDQGLSKGVILIPCNKTITSEATARLLLENLYKRFGLPDKIISDRGPQFASKAFLELLKLLGIKSALSTAYHPQTDGTTERVNQEIEAYLSIYCASHPEEWPQALHTLEFTHNNRRHADRQNTPFELMFGESPLAIPLSFENTKYPSIEEKMGALLRNREEALAAHELSRSRMIERRRSAFVPFKKGDKVWLDSRNLRTIYHKKMKPKREGPFTITEVLGPVTYRLQLPAAWRIHNVFHATLLKPYKENEIYGKNYTEPPPELVEGEEVYEVETILNHRRRGRGYQYFIKWRGYPISDASWEPEHAFSDDGDTLQQYKLRHHL